MRRYKLTDDLIIWELHKLGLCEIGVKPSPDNPLDQDLADIENIYLKDGDFIVGELRGKVVAMGAIKKIDQETAEVKRIRVHPEYRRHGFGSIILKELEKRAKNKGYKKLILESNPKWEAAQHFYRHNGYTEKGRGTVHGLYRAIFYEKEL